MSETFRVNIDTDNASEALQDMTRDLERTVREDIVPLGAVLEDTFASASRSIADELEKAARSGKLSFKSLVQEVLADLARLAADSFIRQPLEAVLSQAASGLFGGSRAGGGAVAPGHAYLVGERGPELFVPAASGHIAPNNGGGTNYPGNERRNITVNLHLGQGADAASLRRSEPQIAAALQRALARGMRNS